MDRLAGRNLALDGIEKAGELLMCVSACKILDADWSGPLGADNRANEN